MKKGLIALLVLGICLISFATVSAAEKITVWAMGAEAQRIGAMVSLFEAKYPDIKVEVQPIPWDSARDKIITSVAGGTTPDVAQMGTTWMAEFGSIGVFADLTNYINNSKLIKKEDFFSGSLQTNIMNGKIYGLPWYVDTRVLFYRTDLLEEIGYKEPPKDWEQFKDVAEKLAAKGEYGTALSTNNYQEIMPFIWQNGGEIINEAGKVTVTEPEFVEALEYYVDFFLKKTAPVDAQGTNLFQEFAQGRMPMYFSGPWMISLTHEQVPEIDGKWSVALMPKKESRTSFVGGSNLIIFNGSKKKAAAWKFVEFMSTAENQLSWYKISGSLPANQLSWKSDYFNNLPMIRVFGEQLNDAKAPLNIPQWAQIEAALQQRVQEACYGMKTPKQAAKDLQKDIEKLLGK